MWEWLVGVFKDVGIQDGVLEEVGLLVGVLDDVGYLIEYERMWKCYIELEDMEVLF